jgi:hypothetical protein
MLSVEVAEGGQGGQKRSPSIERARRQEKVEVTDELDAEVNVTVQGGGVTESNTTWPFNHYKR